MVKVKPFQAYLANRQLAQKILAPEYDVISSKEATVLAKGNPYSFLHVNKPEIDTPEGTDNYSDLVYQTGKSNLQHFIKQNWLERDQSSRYYIYSQKMNGRTQYGLVAASSIEDYENDKIKKHEKTLPKKEEDRTKLIDIQNANIGPVFLTYKKGDSIKEKVNSIVKQNEPYQRVVSEDDIEHQLWKIDSLENRFFEEEFKQIDQTYVADGHHRSAASYNVGKYRRDYALSRNSKITGDEDFNYFMSILYPADQLQIMDYNRVLRSLNNLTNKEFIQKLSQFYQVSEHSNQSIEAVKPNRKHQFSLYLKDDKWYNCELKPEYTQQDPVKNLDVQLLNDLVLDNILGIKDVRTDKRIDFVGGIRGLKELEKRCADDCVAAFAMNPVIIDDLLLVADSGLIMPPKSTWFEPKPRAGFIVRVFDQ
ncbi:UNKNOWN [Stylonychia lemnae]|uniref:DUF1015 domain-containing protein n=1 Tax=Stylonychia lemnae TaxID=5949 RepID=A0A078AGH2_STYLE|nr:UNKNOWN [Stylonychia lemnae]|eukprot:CDW79948.1 UNKNOWN [Stylonychia lemnae]